MGIGPPTQAQAVALLRQDIFDELADVPAGTAQRFADTDLQRALDRALDKYSFVAPYLQQIELVTAAGMRTYPTPAGAWWVETVEYPTGQYPVRYVDFYERATPTIAAPPYPTPQLLPTLADGGVAAPGPGVSGGTYRYKMSYLTPGGESIASAETLPITVAAGHAIVLSGLPLGPAGAVSGRRLYRTTGVGAAGSEHACADLLDNTTTAYVDTTSDGSLGVGIPLVADATAGVAAFTLKLSSSLLPVDTSGVITVQIASKHVLSGAGTSILQWHQEAVLLGAAAYALLAYQTPTNDLFEYQDGEMRDRVDQSAIPAHWLSVGQSLMDRFKARLEEIKRQSDAVVASVARWGDKPARWDRL